VAEECGHPILRSKAFWPIAFASVAGIAGFGYAVWSQSVTGWFAREPEVRVKVAAAKKITAPAVAEAVGQLQASKETDAVSPLPGVLTEVRVKVGDLVKRGEVVAVLRAKELLERADANETAVRRAVANLREMKTQLENAEEKLARVREYYRKDLIARRDVEDMEILAETARAEKERAQAELAQREAALAQARYLLGLTKITAPASGIVTRRLAGPGASLAASAVIMSIGEPAMMRITIKLAPAEASLVKSGMVAAVRAGALPGKIYNGTVSSVEMAVEREGDGATVQIDVPNLDGLLKPGLEVSVSVPLSGARALIVVPRVAVFDIQGKRFVYVVEGRRARLKSVGTGGEISGEIAITSNLAEGEKVIVRAESKIQPRSYVRVVNGAP
jgi:RND family efflux transporter MFP subunit